MHLLGGRCGGGRGLGLGGRAGGEGRVGWGSLKSRVQAGGLWMLAVALTAVFFQMKNAMNLPGFGNPSRAGCKTH